MTIIIAAFVLALTLVVFFVPRETQSVERGSSLLGVVKECPVGSNIVMKVCRGKIGQTLSFVHTEN